MVRYVATSGGLLWGEDNGPQVDLFGGNTETGLPVRVTAQQAVQVATSDVTRWYGWKEWQRNVMTIPGVPQATWQGVVGILHTPPNYTVLRILIPPKMDFVSALYDLEKTAYDLPPQVLASAYLAFIAAKQGRLSSTLPTAITPLLHYAMHNGPTVFRRLKRREIQQWVEEHGLAWLMQPDAAPLPGNGAVNIARIAMELSRFLWSPQGMASVPLRPDETLAAMQIASLWASTHKQVQIHEHTYTNLRNEYHERTVAWLWLQYYALIARNITPIPGEVWEWLAAIPQWLPPVSIDRHLAQGIALSLVRQAESEGVFAPYGQFIVRIPEGTGHPLTGEELHLSAYPDRLWLHWKNWAFCWLPREGTMVDRLGIAVELPGEHSDEINIYYWLDVTLAALWRDLRVAQEEALPQTTEKTIPNSTKQRPSSRRRARQRRQERRIRLPRRLPVRLWGESDIHHRLRRAHGVRAHLRRLPDGWKASPNAKEIAEAFGVTLPEGYTFVRPHVRGGRGEQEVSDMPAPKAVYAKGLMTVCTFLGK